MAAPTFLAAISKLEPLRQGDHDNLCCLYAAINAIRLVLLPIRKLGRVQTKALFVHGARLINERGSLLSVLEDGMEEPLWIELCTSLASEASRLTGVAIKLTRRRRSAAAQRLQPITIAMATEEQSIKSTSDPMRNFSTLTEASTAVLSCPLAGLALKMAFRRPLRDQTLYDGCMPNAPGPNPIFLLHPF